MKDWLKLLNMEVGGHEFGCYVPPCRSENGYSAFISWKTLVKMVAIPGCGVQSPTAHREAETAKAHRG